MTHEHHFPINEDQQNDWKDDWIESLLREQAAESDYLDDAGFTAQVMTALPPVRYALSYDWILAGMGMLGMLVGGIWFDGVDLLVQSLLSLPDWRGLTMAKVLPILLPLVIFYWFAIREALE